MSTKHPKRPRDPAQLAKLIVDIATGQAQEADKIPPSKGPMSDLGRAGGLKGGSARALSLSADRRKDIARKAALARWSMKEK